MVQPSAAAQFVISWHRAFDYTPGAATFLNAGYLFQMCVARCVYAVHSKPFWAGRFLEKLSSDEYLTHLFGNKSYGRCLVLLVPVLGNIVIALHDWKIKRDAVKAVEESYAVFCQLSPWLKSDNDVLDAAVGGVIKAFEARDHRCSYSRLPEYLQKKPLVIEAARQHKQDIALSELDDSYKKDRFFAADVVKNSAHQFKYVDPSLKGDKSFVLPLLHKFTHHGRFEFDDMGGHESFWKREHNETILTSLQKSHPQLLADVNFLKDLLAIDCRLDTFIPAQNYSDDFFRTLVILQPRLIKMLSSSQKTNANLMIDLGRLCSDKVAVWFEASFAVRSQLVSAFPNELQDYQHAL